MLFSNDGELSSARWLCWSRMKEVPFYFGKKLQAQSRNNLASHPVPVQPPCSEGSPFGFAAPHTRTLGGMILRILQESATIRLSRLWTTISSNFPQRSRCVDIELSRKKLPADKNWRQVGLSCTCHYSTKSNAVVKIMLQRTF